MPQKTIVIEVSNLTAHPKRLIKTGIQEVNHQTVRSLTELRCELEASGIRLLLIPKLPLKRSFFYRPDAPLILTGTQATAGMLESIEGELRMPSERIWGFDLRRKGYRLAPREFYEMLSEADHFHMQGLLNAEPIVQALEKRKKRTPPMSATVYDLIPLKHPECCDNALAYWFHSQYWNSVKKNLDHLICISRHTALDTVSESRDAPPKQITVIPIPSVCAALPERASILKRWDLEPRRYLLYVGSVEPRKNLHALLNGFSLFKKRNPDHPVKLVFVGITGWKNRADYEAIASSPFRSSIIETGYVPDEDLFSLMDQASAVAMISLYEGYGLPAAYAHHMHTPVLSCFSSSLPEACQNDGIFVEPHNPESVCAGITLALKKRKKTEPTGSQAAPYTWNDYSRHLIQAILNTKAERELSHADRFHI